MTREVPLKAIEEYLNSIGFSIQSTCQAYTDEFYTSFEPTTALPSLEEGDEDDKNQWFYIKNSLLALICVITAALAAGLTMGLVSQELLDLKIKEVAGNPSERKQTRALIPLMSDHHRLLVTLLLLNAVANEAMPLFLDEIVPGYIAIIMSVTLVLFFGEIIPSAIFSGPNKLAIAAKLAPMVRLILWLLCPLAWPLGKLLDKLLHEHDDDVGFLQKYDRKELSALVRLQYEERKASKLKMKMERANLGLSERASQSMRYVKHLDTVTMVEGALEMHTKRVADVLIELKDVFSIPIDLTLNEESILDIYRSGFSRIPVHDTCGKDHIIGIFRSRQLMVLNPHEERDLSTLPLVIPHCVSPEMTMLALVNLLQEGTIANKGGHMAVVCRDPNIAEIALEENEPIPESAGVLGIVTLEQCIESLIKEEIYDEFDNTEKLAIARARWAANKWKDYVAKKKEQRSIGVGASSEKATLENAIDDWQSYVRSRANDVVDEGTSLLSKV